MKTRVGKIMGIFVVFIVVIAITTVSLGKLDDNKGMTKDDSKTSKEEQKDREHATKEEQKDREHATKEEQKDREHATKEEQKDREHATKEEQKDREHATKEEQKHTGNNAGGNTGGTQTGTGNNAGGNTGGGGAKTGNVNNAGGETGNVNNLGGETGNVNNLGGETGGNIGTGGSTCLIPEGCASTPILKYFIGRGSYKGFDNSKIIGEPDIFEELEFDLKFGIPTNYSFSAYDFAIYEMVAIDKESENKVGIRVTNIKNMSIFSNVEIPEIIFKNESIVTESQRLNNLLIKFKVNNSWIESNKINRENIHLYKLANDSSQLLETILINKDDKYTYFESNESVGQMDRLQLFAISGKV